MKQWLTVYEFELLSYIKNKTFMITTILLAVVLGIATFLPRFFDMSEMLGIESNTKQEVAKEEEKKETEEKEQYGLVDAQGYFSEQAILQQAFPDVEFSVMESVDELKKAVENEEISAGFCVNDDLHYQYFVLNSDMYDENQMIFDELLSTIHQQNYCAEKGIDYATFAVEYEAAVECEENILGKSAEEIAPLKN